MKPTTHLLPVTPANATSLGSALRNSEIIKDTVGQAANELTSVNQELKLGTKAEVAVETIKKAIIRTSDVELKVAQAADDLNKVNCQLAKELVERAEEATELAATKTHLAAARRDLSISLAKEKETRKKSLHDPLTDLPNRALFEQAMEHGLIQAKRHGWRLAVLFIDIDKFKSINDTLGHDAGDKVLQMIASRLTGSFREEDTISRWGGDEFVCLLLEVKHQNDVLRLAELMINKLAETFVCNGAELSVTASIGIAIYPDHGHTADELFKNADKAMYRAKGTPKRVQLHGHDGIVCNKAVVAE